MFKIPETVSSVSTTTLSDDDMSHELATTIPDDLTTSGGTPFSKLFACCIPRDNEEDHIERSEESWGLPPMDEIETEDQEVHNVKDQRSEDTLFDASLILQLAVLGGFLAMQAVSAM